MLDLHSSGRVFAIGVALPGEAAHYRSAHILQAGHPLVPWRRWAGGISPPATQSAYRWWMPGPFTAIE